MFFLTTLRRPLAAALLLGLAFVSSATAAPLKYPATKTVDVADTYFGKTYPDPYRWLEDLKSPEVEAWFKAQAQLTDAQLDRIPARDQLAAEWMSLDKLRPARYRGIVVQQGRVFYKKTLGGENVGKLYVRDGWTGPEKLLFDPSTYKPGVTTTIEGVVPSPDGHYVALGFSSGGAEYSELRVLDVDRAALLPESLYPSVGVFAWMPDSRSFLYDAGKVADIKSPDIELNRKTRLHRVGAPFDHDAEIFSNEVNPDLGIAAKEWPQVFLDHANPEYLVGNVGTVQNEMRLYYAPTAALGQLPLKWQVLARTSDNLVRGFVIHGDYAYAVTHAGAPRYKLVRTAVKNPDWAHAETIIPEAADSIESLEHSQNYLYVVYSNGITGRVVQYDFASGRTAEIPLPASGTVGVSCPDAHSDRTLLFLTSWTLPSTTYDYDPAARTLAKSPFNTAVDYPGFDQLVTEEVEVPSHDGVMVPLSIVHRRDLRFDGSSPCIIEGYGAYGVSITPAFSVLDSIALHGVVVAYAHPRGGSEKGETWYRGGFKTTKPNTWKDFIACAEYLVKKGYTSSAKLGGTGTSAGGILISRAITERPDLFAAAVCNVGCANTLRMEFTPNGPINTPEFGTVADATECAALAEMDGVSHVLPGGKYPAVLGVGGWNDPRVTPWQPGKFVAAVQARSASGKPALLKVNYDNGHFTEEKLVTFKNFASQFSFLLWQAGHPEFQPKP